MEAEWRACWELHKCIDNGNGYRFHDLIANVCVVIAYIMEQYISFPFKSLLVDNKRNNINFYYFELYRIINLFFWHGLFVEPSYFIDIASVPVQDYDLNVHKDFKLTTAKRKEDQKSKKEDLEECQPAIQQH
jgi:hypothetical protein